MKEANEADSAPQIPALVRQIPRGRVASYGALGAHCNPPMSGYVVGRIMANAPDDVPWWRVIGKTGALPIHKRNPHLAKMQRRLLEEEGVKFGDKGEVLGEFFAD